MDNEKSESSTSYSAQFELISSDQRSDDDFTIEFGLEIEFTSAYNKERIKSYYTSCCGDLFKNEAFEKMENLLKTDLRKFVLYRNIISCFANGIDSSEIMELFRNSKPLLFIVKKEKENFWSLQTDSAFVQSKYFKITTEGRNCRKLKLEFNYETLLRVFETFDGSFAMISGNNKILRNKLINFEREMKMNWDENCVEMIRAKQQKGATSERNVIPSFQDLLNQLQERATSKISCLYPDCTYRNFKYSLLSHYLSHHRANSELRRASNKKSCPLCKKMISKSNVKRHMDKRHKE